jgi:hypothetical protein
VVEQLHADTSVESVTFFEDRAEVVRRARVACPAGRSRVVLRGVTLLVDDQSLTARTGDGEAGARVLSARVRRIAEEKTSASAARVAELEEERRSAAEALHAAEAERARAELDTRRAAGLLATWSSVAASVPSRTGEAVGELEAS